MKKKSETARDREIVSSVKREMERPRLTASVRSTLEADSALAALAVEEEPPPAASA